MKIFGSISELVDLAFRLAGGKQVKLKANTQTTSGSLVTVNVPDVAATGDTQNMVLTAATQSLSNKTLSSPTVSGGTINNSVIGGSTPAAGTFTDIVGSTLDINTSAELQTLTIPSMSTAGVLHNNSSGAVSSSLIVNADVDAAAAIAFSKLATLASGNILVGSNTGVPTSRSMSGDVTIDDLGATAIGASKVTNSMLAGSIDRSKLSSGTNYRILANNASGVMSENAALTANEAVATDANGQLVSVTGVSATELGYLSGVTSDIQTQIGNKQDADATLTAIAGVTTGADKYIYFDGIDTAQAGTITSFGRSLIDDADAATSRSTLGLGSMATQSASSVAITGGTVRGVALDRLAVESDSAPISSSTLVPTKGLMIITAGENTLNTISPAVGFNLVNGAVVTLINNEGADVTVTNAGNIQTGTGADFTLKQGAACSLVYSSTLSKYVLSGGAGSGGAAAGSGTLNIVDNPIAESSTTGWTAATNYTVSRDVANSPLAGIIDSCFAISTTTASSEQYTPSISGVYATSLAMPAALRNTKTQVSMYVNVPASSLGVWRVSIYNASGTRMSLSSDSSGATTLPAGFNGQFVCTFDADSSATYTVGFTQTTRTSANTLYYTNVSIGNGITAQGAAISEWQSYTPSSTQGFGTISSNNLRWRRVGSNMEIAGNFTAGTVSGLEARLSLPTGHTSGTSSIQVVGIATSNIGATQSPYVLAENAVTYLTFGRIYTTDQALTKQTGSSFTVNSSVVSISASIPIAEWAGSGTVNLGAGAQVEYVSNSTAWGTTNTTAFAYGPAGAVINGTPGGAFTQRVRFQSPLQSDDIVILEGSSDRNIWFPMANCRLNYNNTPVVVSLDSAGNIIAGYTMYSISGNATDLDITFAQYAAAANDDSPTTAWPTTNAYWRVRKAKASAPVGFGLASPANGAGLVAPRKGQQALTVTGTGWTPGRSVGIYYQDQNGNHRLKFNIEGTSTSASNTTLSISGVLFKALTRQALSVTPRGGTPLVMYAFCDCFSAATGDIFVNSTTNFTTLSISGDVELESKPSWA